MTRNIAGIPIEVYRKKIKNMHLYVKPPGGNVTVSAPLSMSDETIERFVRTKASWIKRQIGRFENQPRQSEREYVSGETIYVWGKQYFLQVDYNNTRNSFVLAGNKAILTVREESTVAQREKFVNEELRKLLKAEIEKRLPVWEQKTGFRCDGWFTRNMKTRWGSFSPKTLAITFNLQLAKKPFECLDYIIVHELGHVKYRNHGKGFIAYMDSILPFWRETKKLLNDFTLEYLPG